MKQDADARQAEGGDHRVAPSGPELPLTILQLDADGSVCSSTSSAFGRSVGELIGARLHDLLTPSAARRLNHVLRAAEEGGVFGLTIRGRGQRTTHRLLVARSRQAEEAAHSFSVIVSEATARRLAAVAETPKANPDRRRILVAEDEPMLLQLSCRVLEQAGFETTAVADGTAVLQALASRDDIGLLVLDLSLPGPPTHDLLRLVRDLEDRPRILLVTGRLPEEVEELLDGIPVPEHLQKPYSNELLIETVHNLLDP